MAGIENLRVINNDDNCGFLFREFFPIFVIRIIECDIVLRFENDIFT